MLCQDLWRRCPECMIGIIPSLGCEQGGARFSGLEPVLFPWVRGFCDYWQLESQNVYYLIKRYMLRFAHQTRPDSLVSRVPLLGMLRPARVTAA
ncbi:hypothetical protein VTK26DRAFT_8666 [Humicola hyalothermophila]